MSYNELTSTRSMNGIISIFSEDIEVNNLTANSIITDNIQINNSMLVDGVTLTPTEISQLDGINTNETIQQQIDNIEADLTNVVTITGTQTITGAKTFSNTTTLTGNLNVNSIDISPLELATLDGIDTTQTIQNQIDTAVTGVTLDTDQVITGFKTFQNGLGTPFIFNEENTGTINGYFSDSSTLLYTSKTGTFAVGSSILSGIDCVNKTLTALTTSPNVASIAPATTVRKAELYTYQGYITASNQVYTITTTGLAANQGIQFTGVSDFIGSISGHLITLLNTTGLTPSSTTLETSIVQIGSDFYFNTEDNYSLQRFVENANLTPPTIVNTEPYTNLYSLLYPAGAPTTTFNRQIVGFNFNNRIYSSDTATKLDMYVLDNLVTTGANDTPYGSKLNAEIAGTSSTIYSYSLPPTNQVSQGNLSGFNDGGLFIFDTTLLSSPGTQAVLSNGTDYQAFTSSIDADNEVQLSYSRLQTTASTTLNSYVKDITGTPFILLPSSQTGKYVNHNTISLVGSNLGGNSYAITSPNTITADLGASFLGVTNYSPDKNTLIFRDGFSNLNINDWYELSSAYGFYITAEPENNFIFTSTDNNDDISPTTDITGCVIVNFLGGGYTFLFGTSSVSNSSMSNTTYAPINNVCFTSNTTAFNNTMSDARTFNNQFNLINFQQPINGGVSLQFITFGNKYYLGTASPSSYLVDDIFEKQDTGLNTNNVSQTGKTIVSITQTVASALYGFNINDFVQNSTHYLYEPGTSNLFQYYAGYNYFVAVASIFTGNQPQANDFIRFVDFNGNFSTTYVTSVTYVPASGGSSVAYYKLFTNFYNASWTDYSIEGFFYRPENDLIDVYRPQTFKKYTTRTSITLFNQTKKYYTPELYNIFNQQTTNLFDTITTTNQFVNEPLNFYSNNAYNALTSVEIDLPATAIADTFTINNFSQTLNQKTFGDTTIFQQGLTASGTISTQYLTASRDISCRDLDASRDVNSVDFNGTGLLTMSDLTKEHPISNVYIGRQFTTTSDNYGLSVGASQTTLNNYVITRNTANNITVVNSSSEVWTNINNNLRLKVTDTEMTFSPSGNERFVSNNAITTLYRTNNNSGADAFANDTNVYMDFYTQNKDYDVRLQAVRRDSGVGTGFIDTYAYRGRFYTGAQKMLEWGYINAANSFLMGAAGATWIQFNTNTEIYYIINGVNRVTSASNGYHYATLHVNTSDRRLKSNIVDVSNALQTINTIEVKEFDKRCNMCCDECDEELSHEIGFIAQQVEETDMSFCVTTTQLNDTKGLKDSCIFSLNVKATQELYALVMKQQEEINSLKERLSYLNV